MQSLRIIAQNFRRKTRLVLKFTEMIVRNLHKDLPIIDTIVMRLREAVQQVVKFVTSAGR